MAPTHHSSNIDPQHEAGFKKVFYFLIQLPNMGLVWGADVGVGVQGCCGCLVCRVDVGVGVEQLVCKIGVRG